jgi:hypothetical protein
MRDVHRTAANVSERFRESPDLHRAAADAPEQVQSSSASAADIGLTPQLVKKDDIDAIVSRPQPSDTIKGIVLFVSRASQWVFRD